MEIKIVKRVCFLCVFMVLLIALSSRPQMTILAGIKSEQDQIQETIQSYFDLRYRSHYSLQLEDLSYYVSGTLEAQSFFLRESDKLEIELRHLERSQLRYKDYVFSLDYVDVSISPDAQTAVVSLIEGHDVEFGNSTGNTGSEPFISSMRNLEHRITLQKENGVWKIGSDEYEDYIWRVIRQTVFTKAEYLSFDLSGQDTPIPSSLDTNGVDNLCSLPDDGSTYAYNRSGAVAYAHEWATAPPPYNPKYIDFTVYGGDCTNFVSQVIYEGGGALMAGDGTYGWYFNSIDDYAAAWTSVYYLNKFVTQYTDFPLGPEGCEITIDQALTGDVIQYSWDGDNYWNHSTIIVAVEDSVPGERGYWVAGHSPDVDNYPFEYFNIDHPDMVYRFVHIERLDGFKLLLPSVYK